MKTVVVAFSDPKAGSDEALGRLFNALFLTLELKEKKQDVTLVFQGAGTRWIAEASKPEHPTHEGSGPRSSRPGLPSRDKI
jgi:hypothetical protein